MCVRFFLCVNIVNRNQLLISIFELNIIIIYTWWIVLYKDLGLSEYGTTYINRKHFILLSLKKNVLFVS